MYLVWVAIWTNKIRVILMPISLKSQFSKSNISSFRNRNFVYSEDRSKSEADFLIRFEFLLFGNGFLIFEFLLNLRIRKYCQFTKSGRKLIESSGNFIEESLISWNLKRLENKNFKNSNGIIPKNATEWFTEEM